MSRFSKSPQKTIFTLMAVVTAFFLVCFLVYMFTNKTLKSDKNLIEVYVLKEDSLKGKMVETVVTKKSYNRDDVPSNALVDIESFKKYFLKNDMYKNEILLSSDITDGKKNATENNSGNDYSRLVRHTFAPGSIPSSLVEGNLIDIVSLKPTTNEILVSKVILFKRVDDNTLEIFLTPNELQILKDRAMQNENIIVTVYKSDEQSPSPVNYKR